MKPMAITLRGLAVLVVTVAPHVVGAVEMTNADFQKLQQQFAARRERLTASRTSALQLFGYLRDCSPADAAKYFPAGAPALNSGESCAPKRSAANAWSEMHICLANEATKIATFTERVEKVRSETSWWSRTTCRLASAWDAFKSSVVGLKNATLGFATEVSECLGEMGRLFTFQPADIKDAALRAEAERHLGFFDRIRRMTFDLDALSPARVLKECRDTLSAARGVASKVIAAVKAASNLAKTAVTVALDEAICRRGGWAAAFCAIISKGKACLDALEKSQMMVPTLVLEKLKQQRSWWQAAKTLPSAIVDAFKDERVKAEHEKAVKTCEAKLVESVAVLGEAACRSLSSALRNESVRFGRDLVRAVGQDLARLAITRVGSEIGDLLCAKDAESGDASTGLTVYEMAKRFGDPKLTIKNITLGLKAATLGHKDDTTATLSAQAFLSVRSSPEMLSLTLEGEASIKPGGCDFSGPMLILSAKVTDWKVSRLPQWLTDRATENFITPNLGCFTFCPPALSAAGLRTEIDYCRVIDSCLTNNCTAPVVNTLLGQLFPITAPLRSVIPPDAAYDTVRREVGDWDLIVSRVKFRANNDKPYRPSVTARISFGPKGQPRQNVDATGTFDIRTYCRAPGKSMVKVTPALRLRVGDFPNWLQKFPIHIFNNFWRGQTSQSGEVPMLWGDMKDEIVRMWRAPPDPGDKRSVGEKIQDVYIRYGGREKMIKELRKQLLALIGESLTVRPKSCDKIRAKMAEKATSSGCTPCLTVGKRDARRTHGAERLVHSTGKDVNVRSEPTTKAKKLGQVDKCDELDFVADGIVGDGRTWTKVLFDGKEAFVASEFIAPGPCVK
ncbi:MAG: SH3 domain-containing protein [Deltaproteobacteria bacterium]|nr:SH3 domain-containing protein [Deltaproteobacteria bacterium]